MTHHPISRRALGGLLAAASAATGARAQAAWPTRAVQMIVPFAAGGPTDAYARALAEPLAQRWGQPVVVDNRPGGGTMIGAAAVAQAQPDGHTLLLTSFGHVMTPLMMQRLAFDPAAMLPVAYIGGAPNILYTRRDLPAANLREFVAFARSKQGGVSFGSSGIGSSVHVSAELLSARAGFPMTHIPYRGSALSLQDLLAGNIDAIFDTPATMSHVRDGRLRAIASGRDARSDAEPDVATFREQGVDMVTESWYGLIAPAGTPEALRERIAAALLAAVEQPATRARLERAGLEIRTMGPERFGTLLVEERRRWGELARERGLRLTE
jgi:tripartite-type tricarboxylate transporter receptor subunit TctC